MFYPYAQILLTAILLIGFGYEVAKDGDLRKQQRHNAQTYAVALVIWFILLFTGGFYQPPG